MTPRLLGVGGGRRLGLDVARPTRAGGLLLLPLLRVAPLEALDAATRVEELLLARVERVAVRADLDAEVALRAPGLERVPAGTVDRRDLVVGVRVRLHVISPSRSSARSENTAATGVIPGVRGVMLRGGRLRDLLEELLVRLRLADLVGEQLERGSGVERVEPPPQPPDERELLRRQEQLLLAG